jgi:hypothetical protein
MHKLILSLVISSIVAISSLFSVDVFASYKKVAPSDLGPLKASVGKFTLPVLLEKHHQHLLDMANKPSNSTLVRYTYALLLGINHANDHTRIMAIEALEKLAKSPKVSSADKDYLNYMKDLIIYEMQTKIFEGSGKHSVAIKYMEIFDSTLVNEYGTTMKVKSLNKSTGQFSAELLHKGKHIPALGYVHDDIISFTTDTVSYLGYLHPKKIKTWWLSTIKVNRVGGDQLHIGDSTWKHVE